jgi:predicted O-methyltransferase YrrM
MSLKSRTHKYVNAATRAVVRTGREEQRGSGNVEVVLTSVLRDSNFLKTANDAVAYVEMLRSCLEPLSLPVTYVKTLSDSTDDETAIQFTTLVETIRTMILPLPVARALSVAAEADRMRGIMSPVTSSRWSADAGMHLAVSSSTGHKGRLLATIVRYGRAERCLELGLAYGLSSLFMLGQPIWQDRQVHVDTVEGLEPQYSIAREMLQRLYPGHANCHFGWTGEVLPKLMATCEPFDFLFHDAGHTGRDYINDFAAVIDHLRPGALALIDDINWNDVRFGDGASGAYEGWKHIVAHDRVRAAVEIDGAMGLALIA